MAAFSIRSKMSCQLEFGQGYQITSKKRGCHDEMRDAFYIFFVVGIELSLLVFPKCVDV